MRIVAHELAARPLSEPGMLCIGFLLHQRTQETCSGPYLAAQMTQIVCDRYPVRAPNRETFV